MSYIRMWVHLVFATKNRAPLLSREIRYKVQEHIIQNCKEKSIYLQAVNGYTDHIHCLILLGKEQSIAKIAQLIKGESSFWINKHKLANSQSTWQDDYFAVSVSESVLPRVIDYIKNQEQHHAKKSFDDEIREFEKIYGFLWNKN